MININGQNKLLAAVIAQDKGGTKGGVDIIDKGASKSQVLFKNPFLDNSSLEGLTGLNFVQKFIPTAVGLIFVVGVIIFLFMILLGAIGWISSGGDKAALEGARGKITNAIIGIIILLSTFALVKIIETFFGINILTIDIGPLIIQ